MHLCICCHHLTIFSESLHHLSCTCQCSPLGWCWCGFSSYISYCVPITVGICPLVVFFSFTGFVVQYLGLSKKNWGICSVLGVFPSIVYVQCIWRSFQSYQQIWWPFPRNLAGLSFLIFLTVSALVSGLLSILPLFFGGVFYGLLIVPYFPVRQSFQKLWNPCHTGK